MQAAHPFRHSGFALATVSLACLDAAAPAAATAQAQTPAAAASAPAADPTRLAPITNTATRTGRRGDAVPVTVAVKSGREAEARAARDLDLKNLFTAPGRSVSLLARYDF